MSANNARVANQSSLEDFLFSEEDITKSVETREHIFEVKTAAGPLGFISLYDLKTFAQHAHDEAGLLSIRNIDESKWTNVFEHPYFQRRKPQLVPASTLEEDSEVQFFILRHGQKTGPYEKHELNSMLEEKVLLLTEMVSTNGGHTWMKLYQVEGFDRRSLSSSEQLPGIPFDGVFERKSISPNVNVAETDALSGLAYLGNVKRGKVIEREKNAHFEEEMTKKAGNASLYKWMLILSVAGISYFLYNIKDQLTSPFAPAQSPIGEQAEMLTPVELTPEEAGLGKEKTHRAPANQFNDMRRSGKFESKSLTPIRPNQRKSFMESGKYQAIKNTEEEDGNYFYDNTSAMELDPVRTQVSKENYEAPLGEPAPLESGDALFDEEVSR